MIEVDDPWGKKLPSLCWSLAESRRKNISRLILNRRLVLVRFMPSKLVSTFKDRFWLTVSERRDVERAGRSREGVWWITRHDDWFRPCWIRLSEYSAGCFRIRNDIGVPIPRSAWSFHMPHYGGCSQFELTFHESELTDDIHELIFSCCAIPQFQFSSPLFKESGEIPHYAWTIKGDQHYQATRKKS